MDKKHTTRSPPPSASFVLRSFTSGRELCQIRSAGSFAALHRWSARIDSHLQPSNPFPSPFNLRCTSIDHSQFKSIQRIQPSIGFVGQRWFDQGLGRRGSMPMELSNEPLFVLELRYDRLATDLCSTGQRSIAGRCVRSSISGSDRQTIHSSGQRDELRHGDEVTCAERAAIVRRLRERFGRHVWHSFDATDW